MDFSFNIDAIAEQKASKNREIDSQVGSMESEASRCENQANSFDTQAASMEAMAVAAAARTITVPDGTDSDGHTRYKTIPCPDGQAQAAALKSQAAALKSQAAQLRAHAGAIRGGVSALRGAQTATNKYLDGIVDLAQRVDLTNAQKLGQMAADIQQYTKNMTDIMNSFNDSFPLVSKDLNPLEKSVLATVVAKVANDIKQAVNVDEVVRDSLEVLPSEMKSDIEAHAKSLGKNMSELTSAEISGIIEVVAEEPKYDFKTVSKEYLGNFINENFYLSQNDKYNALINLGYDPLIALMVAGGFITKHNIDDVEIEASGDIPDFIENSMKYSKYFQDNEHLDFSKNNYVYVGAQGVDKISYIGENKQEKILERKQHVFAKLIDDNDPTKGYVICKVNIDKAEKTYYEKIIEKKNGWDFMDDGVSIASNALQAASDVGYALPISSEKVSMGLEIGIGVLSGGLEFADNLGHGVGNLLTKEQSYYSYALKGANNLEASDEYAVISSVEKYTQNNPGNHFESISGIEEYYGGKKQIFHKDYKNKKYNTQ